jgi:hypothetical protein
VVNRGVGSVERNFADSTRIQRLELGCHQPETIMMDSAAVPKLALARKLTVLVITTVIAANDGRPFHMYKINTSYRNGFLDVFFY